MLVEVELLRRVIEQFYVHLLLVVSAANLSFDRALLKGDYCTMRNFHRNRNKPNE